MSDVTKNKVDYRFKILYAVGIIMVCCGHTGFSDFDWGSYKTDIWWYYMPKKLHYTLIIYVVSGIFFSIIIQKGISFVKRHMVRMLSEKYNL